MYAEDTCESGKRNLFANGWRCGIAALCLAATSSLVAAAGLDREAQFRIPSQSLDKALVEFSRQSKLSLLVNSDATGGLSAPAVNGELVARVALSEILRDSEWTFVEVGNVVAVMPRSAEAARPVRLAQQGGGGGGSESASADNSRAPGDKLVEVIVTAQKRDERLLDVPIPVTAVKADTLAASNQLRLQDYYTRVPGLSVVGGNSASTYQTLSIRGITTGRATNPTVGITVDDVPFGSSTNLGGGNAVPDIDPGDLAQVEVLRGPQGALYGASSMGGLIKFVTLDPSTSTVGGHLQAQINSVKNNDGPGYNLRGSVNVPLSESVAIRASGFLREDPGYIDNPITGQQGINEQKVRGGYIAALFALPQFFTLKLSALYQDFDADGVGDVTPGLSDLQQNYVRGIGPNDGKVETYGATLRGMLGNVELTSVSGYGRRKAHMSQDFSFAFGGSTQTLYGVGGADLLSDNQVDKFSQELRFAGQFGERFDWIVGGFYTDEDSTPSQDILARNVATGAVVASGYHTDLPSTYKEYALFANFTAHLTDRFDIQVGGRGSRIRQTFDSSAVQPIFTGGSTALTVAATTRSKAEPFTYLFTPRYKIAENLMVYARMASGYRAGGANSQLCVANNFPCQYEPDKTQNYELGLKGDFLDHRLIVDGSVYYIDWKNIQVRGTIGQFSYNTNASRAKSQGVELSLETRPLDQLTVTLTGAWNDAKLTEDLPLVTMGRSGDRLPYASKFSGSLAVDQSFPLSSVTGYWGAAYSYVGDRLGGFTNPRARFPSYSRVDFHTGVQFTAWKVNAFVNNAFDRRGLLQGGVDISPTAFIYIQPRTYGLSLERSF